MVENIYLYQFIKLYPLFFFSIEAFFIYILQRSRKSLKVSLLITSWCRGFKLYNKKHKNKGHQIIRL